MKSRVVISDLFSYYLLNLIRTVICFQNCPKLVHNLMLNCWESDKIRRPTFADIVDNIDKFLRSPEDLNDGLSAVTEKYVTLQSLLRSSVFWESALFVVRATQLFCRSKNIGYVFFTSLYFIPRG